MKLSRWFTVLFVCACSILLIYYILAAVLLAHIFAILWRFVFR